MSERKNEFGQPIGYSIKDWSPRSDPPRTAMAGRYCRLEPLDPTAHTRHLYEAFTESERGLQDWTYLSYGPFESFDAFEIWLDKECTGSDPLFYTIVDTTSGRAVGLASYLRIEPATGVIEVGHIHYSPRIQRTPMATETMYLMMRRVFDELGYRRYEWKCDSLNAASCRAAIRLGFQFEGIFRQATVYKGRNRDTAWYSIIDSEWPRLKRAFENWLLADNFDGHGNQLRSLSELMEQAREATP